MNVISRAEVPSGIRVSILDEADKSDPLNQILTVSVRFGDTLAVRGAVVKADHEGPLAAAIAALVGAVIENHAEIRDALSEKS